ncbi:MAG: DUF523 domain-containing protein [Magnetococcus sp. DMHC-1]|nr:DUF523 domain-containing protein [Magnetococcales bacterium]
MIKYLGVSACLLGQKVRYDGNHKQDPSLARLYGRDVTFIPICPEVEAGLGIPREPLRLEGDVAAPRAMTMYTRQDLTDLLTTHARKRLADLATLNLQGFVFMSRSPSCGLDSVPVLQEQGQVVLGRGIFAQACARCFPGLPMLEVGQKPQSAPP